MGAWDTKIFGDDVACDVRDCYREMIEDGVDDAEAMRKVLDEYGEYFEDPESRMIALVALAVTQSKIGRLDPAIRDRAVAVIDQRGDLDKWERESPKDHAKRQAALEAARAQLLGPQPKRKRLKPPVRLTCGLVAGDVLALDLPTGHVLFRTVAIKTDRCGDTPILETLEYSGTTVPSLDVIQDLSAKEVFGPGTNPRFEILISRSKPDWNRAGFRKVGNVAAKVTDDPVTVSGRSLYWYGLAIRFATAG